MSRLVVLMITAFVDMVGLLIILPLLPYYALGLGGGGVAVGVLVAAYAVAQLVTAPLWGRVSDRFGRRPAILVSLGAAAIAYVIFGYAETLGVLLVSRLVQGAGGGTTGVIQAYVSDVTEPDDRAKSLGWLSAATSAGVMVGPAIGSLTVQWGTQAPGLIAAGLCVANMVFAWKFLRESHTPEAPVEGAPPPEASLAVMSRVVREPTGPAPRLIWTYTLAMGAFQGMVAVLALFLAFRFGIGEETIGFVFLYTGFVSVITRAVLLGRAVDLVGEERLSRVGLVLLIIGLAVLPFTGNLVVLGLALALVPLGTAFTFPCVTSMLSQTVDKEARGLYLGVQQSFGGMARIVGPISAGWAWEHVGVGAPFWAAAVLVAATLAFSVTAARPRPAVVRR
jgi:multidrug resistance protein